MMLGGCPLKGCMLHTVQYRVVGLQENLPCTYARRTGVQDTQRKMFRVRGQIDCTVGDIQALKGTLTRDFLHAVFGIKTRPATPLFVP